jgi:cyclophilin family peptidyl-prolyl cis-trans isomerase/HEAT repeat protein
MTRYARLPLLFAASLAAACATAPPPAPPPPPPSFTFEQKLGWIMHLEDTRVLRDPQPIVVPAAPAPVRGRQAVQPPAPAPIYPDLLDLLGDADPRLRRRAAIAIGRVGLADGVEPLIGRLQDLDPDVRQMVAFALGLLADRRATAVLIAALEDADWRVRGRAAEALGRIGDARAAAPVGQLAVVARDAGAVTAVAIDEAGWPLAPPVEAFRLAVYALVRLKAWEPLAAAVLDPAGQPLVRWWPVAYALQRLEDPRALPALLAFASGPGADAQAFAARGLGLLKDPKGVDALLRLIDLRDHEPRVAAQAVRALGQIGDGRATSSLLALARQTQIDDNVRLEVVAALGALRARAATDVLIDHIAHRWPAMRGTAFRALAGVDPDALLTVLSGLDLDGAWTVRAEIASILGTLDADRALPALRLLWKDEDARVLPAVLNAMASVKAPDLERCVKEALVHEDVVVRATAATIVGREKKAGGDVVLREAYERAKADAAIDARAAALEALAAYGADAARASLEDALGDRDWAVRRKAIDLLRALDPAADVRLARPAPAPRARDAYGEAGLVTPRYSPQAYLDTEFGTIQIELDVINAPLTSQSFVTLARRGFFNGVTFHRVVPNFVVQGGDPRGDGEGGPYFTLRDELSAQPYLRGTVGMALSWADTGGSQFFITHGPQPHLDGRYTVFGRVVAGMEVVDRLRRGDLITRVRVWDGVELR